MDRNEAANDLKTIREVMNRTRQSQDGQDGWIMIVWGIIWMVGFGISQFVTGHLTGIIWAILNVIGLTLTFVLAFSGSRSGVRSPLWRLILLWWLSLIVFDGLIVWLFRIKVDEGLMLLIVLTIALGYVQFGLFTHVTISLAGLAIAVLIVSAYLVIPDYLFLSIALIGGGILLGTGVWFVRQRK